MSTNGALGPEASKFLAMVFKFVKAAGMFSMRHSHQDVESTWNTTWFSTFWRQRISSTVAAKYQRGFREFVNRILQRDALAQQGGPCTAMRRRLTPVSTVMTQSKTGDRLFTAATN